MADGTGKAGGGAPPKTAQKGISFTVKGNPDTVAPTRSPNPTKKSTGKFGG